MLLDQRVITLGQRIDLGLLLLVRRLPFGIWNKDPVIGV
jgi:hypothetical protein